MPRNSLYSTELKSPGALNEATDEAEIVFQATGFYPWKQTPRSCLECSKTGLTWRRSAVHAYLAHCDGVYGPQIPHACMHGIAASPERQRHTYRRPEM